MTDSPLITKARLISERGWTEGAIKRFLGEPDATAPNPHHRSGPPMRLYGVDRVEKVEASDEFRSWKVRTKAERAAASARMKSRNEALRAELFRHIEDRPIPIPEFDWDGLVRRAVEHRNDVAADHAFVRQRDYEPASVETADDEALARWAVNYLRHMTTDYERWLVELVGRVGRRGAVDLVRERIYDAIADAYPELGAECRRQQTKRERAIDY